MKTKGSVTSVGDFDLVVENGYYTCNPQSMQHKPNTTSGQASLWVLSEGGTDKLGMQILWDNSDSPVGKVFMRTKYNSSTWQNWVVISTDIPTFYKNYDTTRTTVI